MAVAVRAVTEMKQAFVKEGRMAGNPVFNEKVRAIGVVHVIMQVPFSECFPARDDSNCGAQW